MLVHSSTRKGFLVVVFFGVFFSFFYKVYRQRL